MPRSRPPANEPPPSAPRLTVGQRLLLRLPSLQRERHGGRANGQGGSGSTTAGARSSGARSPEATAPVTSEGRPRATAAKTPSTAKTGAAPETGTAKDGTARAGTARAGTARAGTARTGGAKGGGAAKTGGTPANPGTTAKTGAAPKGADAGTSGTAADDATAPAATPASLGSRLRGSLLKPKPAPQRAANGKVPTRQDPFPDKTSAELKHWLKYLDDQERMLTLVAAPLAAVISVAGIFYRLGSDPTAGKTGYIAPPTIETLGGVGVVLAAAVLAGGLTRRRSFAVFALFFAGFPISFTLGIFGVLPFWGLGFWLFQRSSKMQRSLTHRGDHPRQQRNRASGAARTGGSRAPSPAPGRGRRKKEPEPTGPAPNKRYTPPKPREDAGR